MPTWFNYSPLAPMLERYFDDGSRDLCKAEISIGDTGDFELCLVGNESSIELIRVATLNSHSPNPKQAETIGKLMDHMLAVLRFTYRTDVDFVRTGEGHLSLGQRDVNGKPALDCSLREMIDENFRVNADNIRNTFIASMGFRHLMKLLSDTQNNNLPLQYRYLSLYKAFELEFREGRKWPKLAEAFAPYEARFRELDITPRSLQNLFHDLRDKCAHIKLGSSGDFGIIGLDGPDAKAVAAIFPLLKEIMSAHMSAKYSALQFSAPGEPVQIGEPPIIPKKMAIRNNRGL